MENAKALLDLSFVDNHGTVVPLSDFAGRPMLIVNTASKCGLTPQLEGIQKLYEDFSDQGLIVIGFPCDQFAHQEPGDDAQIEEFCQLNYGVSFPLSSKVDVNGKNTHPVFAFLKQHAGGVFGSSIKWNFTKFLVSPDASKIKRFAPKTTPDAIRADVEAMLSESSS